MGCQHIARPEPPPSFPQIEEMESPEQPAFSATSSWLVSSEARPWFDWLSTVDRQSLGTLTKLRNELSNDQASQLLQQLDLRERATRKFSQAWQMFFSDIGLQQSTDEQIATYKAARFPAGQKVADLCCGIGGDLIAIAQRCEVVAVDASDDHLCFAEANVHAYGAKLADRHCGLAEETSLADFAAWHIDPDRRPEQTRTIRLDQFRPSLEHLEAMLQQNPNAALKLAPANAIPADWEEAGQCEWISNHRECKQLMVWLGNLTDRPGTRRATRIDGNGQATCFEDSLVELKQSAAVDTYLFDPDPALVASGLVDALAARHDLVRVSAQSHYLTGGQPLDHPLLQRFEVITQEKIDNKRLKKAVATEDWGTLELKQRGLELKLETWRKQLKPRGKGQGTIIFTPTVEGNRAILCRRPATTGA